MLTEILKLFKRCPKCQKRKRIEQFWKDKSRKDGHSGNCKLCDSLYSQKLKEEDPEFRKRQLERKRRRRVKLKVVREKELKAKAKIENAEMLRQSKAKLRAENQVKAKEKARQSQAEWRLKNADKVRQSHVKSNSKWHQNNKERVRKKQKKWYQQNPEKVTKMWAKYRSSNKCKIEIDKKNWFKIQMERLSDFYLKQILKAQTGFTIEEISGMPQLIELKRKQLKYKRILKQFKNENHETSEF